MTSRWETVQVNGEPMNVFLDSPAGPGPHPGVIVIMHIGGVDEFGPTTAHPPVTVLGRPMTPVRHDRAGVGVAVTNGHGITYPI